LIVYSFSVGSGAGIGCWKVVGYPANRTAYLVHTTFVHSSSQWNSECGSNT